MKERHTIGSLFTAWGRANREPYADTKHLKELAFSKLQGLPQTAPAPRSLLWLPLSFATLGVFALVFASSPAIKPGLPSPAVNESATDLAYPQTSVPLVGNQWYKSERPISDTREFLKTSYSATIRTRNVADRVSMVQAKVRGYGGRIDSANSSERWGSVSFAVPASVFPAFQNDLRNSVRSRFFTEDVRVDNLLPQKMSIEELENAANKDLATLKAERSKLSASHASRAATIQKELSAVRDELAAIRSYPLNDPVRSQMAARENELMQRESGLSAALTAENAAYARGLSAIDQNIRNAEGSLENARGMDKELSADLATVHGTISVQRISVPEILDLYLTVYWLPGLFFVGAVTSYWLYRRRVSIYL